MSDLVQVWVVVHLKIEVGRLPVSGIDACLRRKSGDFLQALAQFGRISARQVATAHALAEEGVPAEKGRGGVVRILVII